MIPILLVNPDLKIRIIQISEILTSFGLGKSHPNVLYIGEEEKLGVETVSKISDHLLLKPYQKGDQTVVLESAENLTSEAQNSLLKTLEEPPKESLLILGVSSEDKLLPTVISRCEVRNSSTQSDDIDNLEKLWPDIEKLLESQMESRFQMIEKITDKEQFLKAIVSFFRKKLIQNPDSDSIKTFFNDLIEAESLISANVNQRAVLEYLILKMPNNLATKKK